MSIIKNNISASDTHVTIRTFKELVDSGYTYEVKKSFNYVAQHDEIGCYPTDRCTIQILCDIPNESGNNGFFFGQHVSGGYLSVQKDGNTIKYYRGNGTTPVATHAYETGFHQYGFVNGIPVYDNQALTDAPTGDEAALAEHWISIGRANNANTIPKINVQRVNILAGVGGQFKEQAAYYPTVDSEDSTYMIWFEARQRRQNTQYLPEWIETNARAFTNFNNDNERNGYGVQLDDLRTVFGSGYRDLSAVVADDGGVDENCGWTALTADSPYTHLGKHFAFSLSGTPISPTRGGTHVPGTHSNTPEGQLMKGRKPKWNIWNDCIAFGFYVHHDTSVAPSGKYELLFNLFRRNNGTEDKFVRQERFNGYDTSKNHHPLLVVNPITVEYHNGYPCLCDASNMCLMASSSVKDEHKVFKLDSAPVQGEVSASIGNAAPWNALATDIQNTYTIYGMCVKIALSERPLVTLCKHENNFFHVGTSDAIKSIYRGLNILQGMSISREYQLLLYESIYSTASHQLDVKAELNLLQQPTDTPSVADMIDMSQFVPARHTTLTGVIDSAIVSGSTNYRMLLDEQTAQTIALVPNQTNQLPTRYVYASGLTGYIYLPFMPCTVSGGVPVPSATAKSYVAVLTLVHQEDSKIKSIRKYIKACMTKDELPSHVHSSWWLEGIYRVVRDGVQSASSSQSTIHDYTRFAYFSNADINGLDNSDVDEDSTAVMTIYDAATAPHLIRPPFGLDEDTQNTVITLNATTKVSFPLSAMEMTSGVASYQFRIYDKPSNVWVCRTTGAFNYKVTLRRNGSIAAQVSISQTGTDYTYEGYTFKVVWGTIYENYYHSLDGSYEDKPSFFYRLDISGTRAPGDLFTIDIATIS